MISIPCFSFHVLTFAYFKQKCFSANYDFFSDFQQMKTVQIRTCHAGLTLESFDFRYHNLFWFFICLAYYFEPAAKF